MRPLRVLLYSATLPTHAGGVQNVVRGLARGLRRRGHEVAVCWASESRAGEDSDAWVMPLRLKNPGRGPLAPVTSAMKLWESLRAWRPDIVNVHFVSGQALYFLLLGRALGYPTVITGHGADLSCPNTRITPLIPHMLRNADAVTVVSPDLKQQVARYGVSAERTHLIPNGVDLGFWSAAERRPELPLTLVAVGRLEPVKGFDVLLQAFALARVAMGLSEMRLKIVGDGSQLERLRAQAEALRLSDVVEFTGLASAASVRALLGSSSAFVLSSHSEGMPLAVLEAAAAATPIVSTEVGAVRKVLGDEAALFVPPADPAALAEAIKRVLLDPELARNLGRAAQLRSQLYSNEAMEDRYEALFAELVARRHSTSRAA